MIHCFIASFSRSSEGALTKLKKEMGDMLTTSLEEADYILAVGDRWETYDFVLGQWRAGKKIIHLWAGEGMTQTEDDVYRDSITLMSEMQLCTNEESKRNVEQLLGGNRGKLNAIVVGNVMLDNLEIDESLVPSTEYDLKLINGKNPGEPTIVFENEAIELPQGSLPRAKFLGLLKNCRKFITNSSCQYYEAPLFLKPEQIIQVGERNKDRGSKTSDMSIPNATANIIREIQKLDKAGN